MTTVLIEMSDQKAAALKAKALKRGVSAEQYVRQLMDRDLEQPATPPVATAVRRHISEVIKEITNEAPLSFFLRVYLEMVLVSMIITYMAHRRKISECALRRHFIGSLLRCFLTQPTNTPNFQRRPANVPRSFD